VTTTIIAGILVPYTVAEAIAETVVRAIQALPNPERLPADIGPFLAAFQQISRRGVSGGVSTPVPADSNGTWPTPSTVAKRLNMSKQNVAKRCRLGSITATKDATGVWRISPEELERLAEASSAAS
jgi:hypothetical protein